MKAVFLHGFGADCLSWLGNLGALPEVDRSSPDLRGHGSSLGELNDGSIEDLAEGVLQEIGDGPPAWLVGHSLGGGVALWLAANYPERWNGLVLMAPLGLGQGINFSRLQRYPDTADEDEMMDFLESLVFDKGKIKREFASYAMSQLREEGGRDALHKIVDQIPSIMDSIQQLLPQVADTGLDVTVFWGRNDDIMRPNPELIENIGTLMLLPEVGHIIHVEAMKEINAHLRKTFGLA